MAPSVEKPSDKEPGLLGLLPDAKVGDFLPFWDSFGTLFKVNKEGGVDWLVWDSLELAVRDIQISLFTYSQDSLYQAMRITHQAMNALWRALDEELAVPRRIAFNSTALPDLSSPWEQAPHDVQQGVLWGAAEYLKNQTTEV
ncbi:MAG: hypothetical protein Q7S68_00590 [Deltaproteobacteria bacterium]|nr:hypothetical protein [Deltaproteobacteria bacterium]